MPNADALILERAERDLEEGLAHTRDRIRASHPNPFVWRPMEAAVMGAVATIQLRHRYRGDVTLLLSLAHRVAEGADPAKLAEENIARVLHTRELALIVREKDPAFERILAGATKNFAIRLPDLAKMVKVADPADYADLVRKAFPERREVELIIQENRAFTMSVIDEFAAHPHMLRVPAGWIPKLNDLSREVIEWQTARILRALDEIYA